MCTYLHWGIQTIFSVGPEWHFLKTTNLREPLKSFQYINIRPNLIFSYKLILDLLVISLIDIIIVVLTYCLFVSMKTMSWKNSYYLDEVWSFSVCLRLVSTTVTLLFDSKALWCTTEKTFMVVWVRTEPSSRAFDLKVNTWTSSRRKRWLTMQ